VAGRSVLIIDESPLFRDYLGDKLESLGVVVIKASHGVDGGAKLVHHRPHLVIADYFLSQRSLPDILKAKRTDVTVSAIPVIVCTTRLSSERVLELSQLGVRKVFMKPLRVDQLWQAVAEVLAIKMAFDETPCVLDAYVNDTIIFVELAMGLNLEKINLLQFKLQELMDLHGLALPRFLVMISSLEWREGDTRKLQRLFEILINLTRGRVKWIKVLTQFKPVVSAFKSLWELSEIAVCTSLETAMADFWDKGGAQEFLQDVKTSETAVGMRFDNDKAFEALSARLHTGGSDLTVAVVDDDFIVQEIVKNTFAPSGARVLAFDDGHQFLARDAGEIDVLFLDLMMPGLDGFGVMESLKSTGNPVPVIVLSALNQRETVLRAMSYGIRSYLTKPLKPDALVRKTFEVMGSHF